MKITGSGPINAPSKTRARRKSGGVGSTDFRSHIQSADSGAPPGVGHAGPVNSVGSILALQEVGDATEGTARAWARGEDILDGLDDLRLALLSGTLPLHRLQRLGGMVRQARLRTSNPGLNAVLDEIELRAAVELAKFEMSKGR